MNIRLQLPKVAELKPRIAVIGVGGAGGNAIENMITAGLEGVDFIVANTDAQALSLSSAANVLQLGATLTEGLGAGSKPEIGEAAAEEALDDIRAQISGSHMVFIAAGMGGGTGTGAASVIARTARELDILTVAIVTKPFLFEGTRRMRVAEAGIAALKPNVDTLIVIPNQNLFRIADEKTTFSDAFLLADQVLHSGISCIVDLIVRDGLINLDFADVKTIMKGMGDAVMGAGEAGGDRRAERAAEQAIANPLLDNVTLAGAKGLLISIAGGKSLTLYEVDEAANRVKREVDPEANIIVGATVDEEIGDRIRVSIVASGMSRMRYGAAAEWGGTTAGYADQAHDGWRAGTVASRQDDVEQFEPEGNPGPMPPPLPEWPDPDQSEADRDRQDDLAAALSEALGRPESEWQSTKGVTIKEALPDFGAGEDNPPDHNAARPPQPERGAAGFVPRLTEAPRRHVPRVPEVEDFPLVAQREYHAKRGHAPQSGASGGEPVQGRPAPERRPTLFERITGVRRRPVDSHDERKTPANGVSDDGRDVDKRGYGNSGRDPYRDGQAPHSQGVFRGKGRR